MKYTLTLLLTLLLAPLSALQAAEKTGVSFQTTDAALQRLYDAAESKVAENVVQFTPTMKVLVEGGGYPNAWLETQPMGGEMYAKRDLEVALNNQRLFMQAQRADGRLPGMVISGETARRRGSDRQPPEGMIWMPEHDVLADFEMFQGYCFPDPAWRMYFWAGKDRAYLTRLCDALERHDAYLWRTRDSNGDGLLETWCVWDTGEDHSSRLLHRNAPSRWPFDFAPIGGRMPDPQDPGNFKKYWIEHHLEKLPPPTREQVMVPFASMDVMAYSYQGRAILAKIARELDNGREAHWQKQAEDVRQRFIQGLWDPARAACFDRDRNGKRLEELVHNNLRCMWYGVFTQEMADAFIRRHLLNPAEFWTPVPLVSIAANDSLFRNVGVNNFSGQPQGLTFQRAIRALENYGHYSEVSLVGQKLLPVLIRNGGTFTAHLDPFTGAPSGPKPDGYGPMILAALEYISRMHGIHLDVENDRVWWSALRGSGGDFSYTQRWGGQTFALDCKDGQMHARLNERELFSCSAGARVVTDLKGTLLEVVGIQPESQNPDTFITRGPRTWTLSLKPNQVVSLANETPKIQRTVPFDYPYAPPRVIGGNASEADAGPRASVAPGTLPPQAGFPVAAEFFSVGERPAFLAVSAKARVGKPRPWVLFAPSLPNSPNQHEEWMLREFLEAGVSIAGIDVGESNGNPDGRTHYTALYRELTERRGMAPQVVLLGRSRGGLMTLCWAVENSEKVAAFAGIFPVCNLASWPGLAKAAPAYGTTPEELQANLAAHNPVDRLAPLAAAKVPLFAIHGDADKLVPLDANSALLKSRYTALGGEMELLIPPGQGHTHWEGFFQCRELVAFVVKHALR